MKNILYKLLARLACFACHGRCCCPTTTYYQNPKTMTRTKTGWIKLIEFSKYSKNHLKRLNEPKRVCEEFNPLTEGCKVHKKLHFVYVSKGRIEIKVFSSANLMCVNYKCRILNVFSKMFNEPIWDWKIKVNVIDEVNKDT